MEIDPLFRDSIAEQIGERRFGLWFKETRFTLAEERLTVFVPTSFLGDWIRKNHRHILLKTCNALFGKEYPIEFVVGIPAAVTSAVTDAEPVNVAVSETPGSSSVSACSPGFVSPVSAFPPPETAPPVQGTLFPLDILENLSPKPVSPPGKPSVIGVSLTASSIATQGMTDTVQDEKTTLDTRRRGVADNNRQRLPRPRTSSGSAVFSGRSFATYDSFVTGMSNRLAKSAAEIAVTEPGTINPILIYGPTSVGKTHLLEGIYSEYRKRRQTAPPKYLTADEFTSLFIQSIHSSGGENRGFRSRFNDISLLIIDDIHFLKGKEATQTELIHLIDHLRRQGVQMIFSADRPLGELTELKSELLTRIESGMVCGIKSAERETLLGIFRQMAAERGLPIPDDVCRFVVSRFTAHARQLSGALNRLHAAHLATGRPYSIETAADVLADLARCRQRTIRLEEIEKTVAEIFRIPAESLRSRSKARQFSQPRMLAMWLARKYTRSALSEIGRYFGNRSHSTVVSAQKRVDSWLQSEGGAGETGFTRDLAETLRRAQRVLDAETR